MATFRTVITFVSLDCFPYVNWTPAQN